MRPRAFPTGMSSVSIQLRNVLRGESTRLERVNILCKI